MRGNTKKPPSPKIQGHWVLGLFAGLPLLAMGGCAGSLCVQHLANYHNARSWAEVSALIDRVSLNAKECSEIRCSYTYTFGGRQFQGKRVALLPNYIANPWQQPMYDRLQWARDRRLPVPCYVNPAHPDEAALDRELRWHTVGSTAFMTVGFGFLGGFFAIRGANELLTYRRSTQRARRYPKQPWLWNPKWATGVIHGRSNRNITWLWFVAILLDAAVLVGLVAMWPHPSPLLLCLAAIGTANTGFTTWVSVRTRRLSGARLELDTMPGVIGGRLKGTLSINRNPSKLSKITATLRCVRTVVDDSGENRTIIWADIQRPTPPSATTGRVDTALPLDFEIPYSRQVCDDPESESTLMWELEIQASAPGPDLNVIFDVPVFLTETRDLPSSESSKTNPEDGDSPFPGHVRCERGPSGSYLLQAAARPRTHLVATILILAVLLGSSGVFSVVQNIRGKGSGVFTVLSFAGSVMLFWMALRLTSCSTVRLQPGILHISRYRGLFHVTRELAIRDIVNVTCDRSNDSDIGDNYIINAHTADGQVVQLTHVISGRMPAQWFYNQFVRLAAMHDVKPSQQSQEERPQGA